MASQSLYRKWRSQTFGELVGQEPVIRTLKNALNSGNLAHAYLFTGPRGTGKTSTARLLAKTVNCPNTKEGEPCNVCEQCREITAGNSFNVVEIDAASNRGIDSIRELREKVMMPPTVGKYKVYILDEAHMLTVEAFNALLKTLEEPPPHAIFVMATTDVHKMLPTVLSRCQRFDFKRITLRQIIDHLRFVASQEHVTVEVGAAELIARAAAGGMRDALSLLDQAIAYAGETISLAQVQAMLGVADPRAIQKFISAVADLGSSVGLHLIHDLAEAGADLRQINTQVAEYWRAMMLAKAGANIGEILDYTEDEVREITHLAQSFALDELTECARVFAQNELVQKNQGTPHLGLELALLACLDLHRRAQNGQSLASALSVPTRPASSPTPTPGESAWRASTPAYDSLSRSTAPVASPPHVGASPTPISAATSSSPVVQPVAKSQPSAAPQSVDAECEPNDLPDWDDVPSYDDGPHAASVSTAQPVVRQPEAKHTAGMQGAVGTGLALSLQPPSSHGSAMQKDDGPLSAALLQEVKEKWEYIKRRVKSKKDGAMIAALLNGYTVVGLDESDGLPAVIIRANAAFHYTTLQKPEHYETIEWALKLELRQACKVRMLPPGQGGPAMGVTIPQPSALPPALNSMVSRATLTSQAASPSQSVRRERPTSNSEPAAPPDPPVELPLRPQKSPVASSAPPALSKPAHQNDQAGANAAAQDLTSQPVPLARKANVRENTTEAPTGADESRMNCALKKAKNDQVVQEAVRLFKAEVKDIKLK
jgi:DNA polymerase-3 subunit gamma/tau